MKKEGKKLIKLFFRLYNKIINKQKINKKQVVFNINKFKDQQHELMKNNL